MLKGTLDDFTLADIFKLLSFSKKTGRLDVARKAGHGNVYFRDGEVYFAESSLSREPLGQKLIRARALTDGQLRKALDEHADGGRRVGQILLDNGVVTQEQLEAAVKQQIEDAVFDLLRWELGDFDWMPGEGVEPEIPISVSVENLIMESSRRLDELEIMFRKVPSAQAVVAVSKAPPEGAVEINITAEEWRILVLVDGRRSVEEIASIIDLDEFQTLRVIYGLVSAGLVEVVGETDAGEAHAPAPEAFAPPPPPPPVESHEPPAAPAPPADGLWPQADEETVEGGNEPADMVDAVFADADEAVLADEPAEMDVPETEAETAASEVEPQENGVAESWTGFGYDDVLTANPSETDAGAAGSEEAPYVSSEADTLPDDSELVEETLFEAGVVEEETFVADTPPAEWFEDPQMDGDVFDAPAPGDLVAEIPPLEVLQEAPAGELDTDDDVRLEEDPAPEAAALDAAFQLTELTEAPAPPPPSANVTDRTNAVRELVGLFDEEAPVERPKPPVIRRLSPEDADARKRRVEDDEQVTKGLISRLIEGVKGL